MALWCSSVILVMGPGKALLTLGAALPAWPPLLDLRVWGATEVLKRTRFLCKVWGGRDWQVCFLFPSPFRYAFK